MVLAPLTLMGKELAHMPFRGFPQPTCLTASVAWKLCQKLERVLFIVVIFGKDAAFSSTHTIMPGFTTVNNARLDPQALGRQDLGFIKPAIVESMDGAPQYFPATPQGLT